MNSCRSIALALALLTAFSMPACPDDGKSDADLLELARNRNQLERVTADPVLLSVTTMMDCIGPKAKRLAKEEENPHAGQFVHVYADAESVEPLWTLFGSFPQNSFLLKEKFAEDQSSKPLLFTGMIKREPGYFPDGGDWEYFTLDGELTQVTSRGKLESCAACHRDFADWDYVSKQYTSVPPERREYYNYFGLLEPVIAAGSSGVIYLPASRAETHGPKLSRTAARLEFFNRQRNVNPEQVPEDWHEAGGPTLRYEGVKEKDTLGYWTCVDDWAVWQLDVRQPGKFRVSVLQGCGPGSGGSQVALLVADQTLKFVVEETGGFQNFTWREIGRIEIAQPGRQTLTVKPLSKPGLAVMDLRMISLRPE
jgi:hypothetical protein